MTLALLAAVWHRHLMRHLYILALLASPVLAESPVTADEFETYVTGRTLTFSVNGQSYGIERYLPNRQVLWSFMDGQCSSGTWYPDQSNICFKYDFRDAPQCWEITKSGDVMQAIFVGEPVDINRYEIIEDGEPLICNNFGS